AQPALEERPRSASTALGHVLPARSPHPHRTPPRARASHEKGRDQRRRCRCARNLSCASTSKYNNEPTVTSTHQVDFVLLESKDADRHPLSEPQGTRHQWDLGDQFAVFFSRVSLFHVSGTACSKSRATS